VSNCGLWGRGRCSAEATKATPKLVAPGERRRPTSWPGGCCRGEKSGQHDVAGSVPEQTHGSNYHWFERSGLG